MSAAVINLGEWVRCIACRKVLRVADATDYICHPVLRKKQA